MMFFKKGCAWWVVFIIAVLTFLVGFLWGTAASSRTGSPVAIVDVPLATPVVADPPKSDPAPQPVPVADPPKAEQPDPPASKVEPVNIEGISDDAWKSARVILRPSGSTMGVFLSIPVGTIVTLPIPSGWSVGDQRFVDIFVKNDGREKSEGMIVYHPEHRDGRKANQLGMVALGADQRFVPKIVDGKVIFLVSDPRGLVFAYPGLGEGFGNFEFSFISNQTFVEMADKRLFVRLYLEWMARHPSQEANTKSINLLEWWGKVNAGK